MTAFELKIKLYELLHQGLSIEAALAELHIPEQRFARWLLNKTFRERLARNLLARDQYHQFKSTFPTGALPPVSPPPRPSPQRASDPSHQAASNEEPSSDIDQGLLNRLIAQNAKDRAAQTSTKNQ